MSAEDLAQLKAALPSFLLFATTWSVGASCDKTGRIAFDMFLKSKAAGEEAADHMSSNWLIHLLSSIQ